MFFTTHQSSTIGAPQGTYHYDIVSPNSGSLAITSSDDSLRIVDSGNLKVVREFKDTHKDGVTSLKIVEPFFVATAGRDGTAKVWDVRSAEGREVVRLGKATTRPISSLATSADRNLIATGTEIVSFTAEVTLWDIRKAQVRQEYVESHNDDITELNFHPTEAKFLLSGSTDGLINIYDINITDEEETLHQVINHGSSVHHAGFLSPLAIYGLSHDENLSVYQLANPSETVDEPSPVVFGDLREKLKCEYVVNVLPRGDNNGVGIIAAGNCNTHTLNLFSLAGESNWTLAAEDVITLAGAHGDEIVRSIFFDDASNTVFTGGEDGTVRAWKASV